MPTQDQPSLLARLRAFLRPAPPINAERIVTAGISCRDCIHFADVDEPLCWHGLRNLPTKVKRSNTESCGPEARLFEPIVAHA